MTPGAGDDGITPEALAAAGHARQRARDEVPRPEDLAGMTIDAATGVDMSPAEIRRLAADALAQSQKIAFLLGRLAELVPDGGDPEPPR